MLSFCFVFAAENSLSFQPLWSCFKGLKGRPFITEIMLTSSRKRNIHILVNETTYGLLE